ncbi:MAG TPA: PilZ domain-containing protein [Thermoanaerobaculaceae bacterium]|nr:PilZ domain-containing protein [Thermoanaerobaculaceae bacterium]
MYGAQRNTLAVALQSEVFESVARVLRANQFHAEYEATATNALETTGFLTFDAILAGYPLPDMPMQAFLDAVRREESPCRSAGLILLVGQDALEEAQRFVGRGANRVLTVEEFMARLPHILLRLLEVPPRVALRRKLRLEVSLSPSSTHVTCQSENISTTGMLVRTDRSYPIGTQLGFELTLPGDSSPVRGYAVVVRHTMADREPVNGFAVQFASFAGEDKVRFETLLRKLLSAPDPSEAQVQLAPRE